MLFIINDNILYDTNTPLTPTNKDDRRCSLARIIVWFFVPIIFFLCGVLTVFITYTVTHLYTNNLSIMAGQPHGSDSSLVDCGDNSKETVFYNNKTNFPRMAFNSHALMKDNVRSQSKINLELNPIGSLQELCVARHCPIPVYTFSDENLKKHKVEFRVVCSISIYKSSGSGLSKQAAKKQAAYSMYKQIEKLTSEDIKQIWDNECEDETPSNPNLLQHHELPCSFKLFLSHESLTHLKIFFNSDAPKIPDLQKKYPTASDTLNAILETEDITLKSYTISCDSDKGKVLVQINTIPRIVILGSGENESDAQESAAHTMLSYFKYILNIK